jgi:hypothetical protein
VTDKDILAVLADIRNWVRAASHASVKLTLQNALPDAKSRRAYQMFDGKTSADQIRKACKMSPNAVSALAQRCGSMGLIEQNSENKRQRLFDLNDFGLLVSARSSELERGNE